MKSTLVTRIAAVALLAPLGVLTAVQPAAAQQRVIVQPAVVAPQAQIERFVLHPGALEAGRELRFRLVGAPGAQAFMEIPGVLQSSAMAEIRPGVYELGYVIRWRDNPDAFRRAVATLRSGGQQVSARVDVRGGGERQGRARDDRAPQVSDLMNRVNDRGLTVLSARFSDEGSGIDTATVVLRVDGRDVTGRARIEADEVRFRDDLAPGRHVAELVVRDRAGNATRRSWTFDVERERDRGYSYNYNR